MKKNYLYILSFLPVGVLAQSGHIISFKDKLVVTAVMTTKNESFSFRNDRGQNLEYSTTDILGVGLGVDYKWLSFEYTTRLTSRSSDELYGRTDNFGIGFGITQPRWYFRNFWESYSGYHITNPDYVRIGYLEDNGHYPYRSDIHSTRYFATWKWVFNSENYSTRASFSQLERQEKSAGSWVVGASFGTSSVGADASFIPEAQEGNFEEAAHIRGFRSATYAVNGGYHYTWTIGAQRKWFLHIGSTPGIAYHSGTWLAGAARDPESRPGSAGWVNEFRITVGYNGDRWYGGSSNVTYSSFGSLSETVPISNHNAYFRLYLGYRFVLPARVAEPLERFGL